MISKIKFWWARFKWKSQEPMIPIGCSKLSPSEKDRFALARYNWRQKEPKEK